MRKKVFNAVLGIAALVTIFHPVPARAQRITSAADLRAAVAAARPGTRISIPAGTYDIGRTPIRRQTQPGAISCAAPSPMLNHPSPVVSRLP